MIPVFKVGEIAIMCNGRTSPKHNGMECEILEPLAMRGTVANPIPRPMYVVRAETGEKLGAEPHQLRKRPPQSAHDLALADTVRQVIARAKAPT